MNRTDRLLAIVLELQAKSKRRAQDLAVTFETSTRTIYRDIQALSEAGVPIVSVPGQGYSLVEGYFLPPLRFSSEEAIMLLLGSAAVAQEFDAQYRASARSASRKIEAVLPEPLRQEVHDLENSIRFIRGGELEETIAARLLPPLRRAILAHQTVRFQYHARSGSGSQTREADPYALANLHSAWYLVAHDHARKALRRFRLDRMDNLQVLNARFVRPADFTLQQSEDPRRNLVIRALFDQEIARWVKEARFYYVVKEEEQADGLMVTLNVRQENEVLPWLLSWGAHVRVLEPESLRRRMAEEARGIFEKHG